MNVLFVYVHSYIDSLKLTFVVLTQNDERVKSGKINFLDVNTHIKGFTRKYQRLLAQTVPFLKGIKLTVVHKAGS